jgi:hypothetical protein
MATYLVTLQHHQHARQEIHKVQDRGPEAYCSRHEVVSLHSKNMRIHRVVNKEENQTEIIQHLHDHSEHKCEIHILMSVIVILMNKTLQHDQETLSEL